MKRSEAIEAAAQGVLVPDEQISNHGVCWAAQVRPGKSFLFRARRQYLMALTDRRLLVFGRRRRGLSSSDLIIAKRYEAFTLDKVKRSRPLMQVRLTAANGARFVFEFRPRQRELGGELVARMRPGAARAGDDTASTDQPAVVGAGSPTSPDPDFWQQRRSVASEPQTSAPPPPRRYAASDPGGHEQERDTAAEGVDVWTVTDPAERATRDE